MRTEQIKSSLDLKPRRSSRPIIHYFFYFTPLKLFALTSCSRIKLLNQPTILMGVSMPTSIPKLRNGIYSFFIRVTGVDLTPEEMEALRKYAIKTVNGGEMILYVGKYWIVTARKLYGETTEYKRVRCFRDICEPHEEIEPLVVYGNERITYDVNVECEEWKKVDNDITDFDCIVRYKYAIYRGIIAIAVDPFDIMQIADDDELKSLLDIASRGVLLVRPM